MMQIAAETPVCARAVYGVHTYDMLKNPIYAHAFQYVPVQVGNNIERKNLIISEDQDNVYKCA